MKLTHVAAVGLLTGVALAWTAPAEAQDNPWSVSFDLGAQTSISGDVHGGGRGTVLNLPTNVTAKTYGDIYGTGFYWAAGVGYKVTENGEIRVQASYTSNPSERLQVGDVATLPLFAEFGDYQAFGMDFGYRQYFGSSAFKPFVGATAGFTNIDAISSTFSVPAAGVTLSNVPMNDSSTVPSFGFQGGAQMALNERLAFQVGVDFRWHGALDEIEGLAGTGLEGINDETSRWALPITAGLTVRF